MYPLKVWDLARGKEVHHLAGHTDSVSRVAVTPDGRYVVSGSGDETLRVWDLSLDGLRELPDDPQLIVSAPALFRTDRLNL